MVRLEKLLRNIPSDPAKRRAHEQGIVPWIAEDLVKLCPSCAKSFNIARRKHHCRLCGSIMCGDCSAFVTFEAARKILNMEDEEGGEDEAAPETPTRSKKEIVAGLFKPKNPLQGRHGSQESLNTIIDGLKLAGAGSEQQFRICGMCKSILERQESKMEALVDRRPPLLRHYERLQGFIREGIMTK